MKQSLPTIQPQPNQPVYGSGLLNLFTETDALDRPTYEAANGEQAPQFRADRFIKKWRDSSKAGLDPAGTFTYSHYVLGPDSKVSKVPFTMTNDEAANVNLTGSLHYPKYIIKPSFVTQGGLRINDSFLSMKADAEALAKELMRQPSDVVEDAEGQPFPFIYPEDELRRVWYINYQPDLQLTAGSKIKEKNQWGVGAPTHWHFPESANQEPTAVRDIEVTGETGPTHPQMPVPQRELLANEAFATGADAFMSGVGFVVHRTDMGAAATGGTGNGGGLTTAQDKMLTYIGKASQQILSLLNPPAQS